MEIPYEVTPRRDTGLYNAKLGIWLFLASEVMLFGGLFSAYVFLRFGVQDGVDNPWPWGVGVHKNFVWLGAINTVVLIASSVGVVFAWVALKERNWRRYQIMMYFVVACAVIFMCLKTVEYNSKLNHHHGIKLADNSVMEGVIKDKTDRIRFNAEKVTFSLQGALPAVFQDLDDSSFPVLKVTDGPEGTVGTELMTESEFQAWFHENRRLIGVKLAEERKRYRAEIASGVASPAPVAVSTSATVTAASPFAIHGNPRKVVRHSDVLVNYKDGVTVEGKLVSDDVIFELHEVDLQLVLPQRQRKSAVWTVVNDESAKQQFFASQSQKYQELVDYYQKRNEVVPEKMIRGHYLNVNFVHVADGSHDGHDSDHGDGKEEAEKDKHDEVHHGETKPSAWTGGGMKNTAHRVSSPCRGIRSSSWAIMGPATAITTPSISP